MNLALLTYIRLAENGSPTGGMGLGGLRYYSVLPSISTW